MSGERFECQGVFFDLYGTLLRYGAMDQAWRDWLAAMRAGLAEQGHDLAADDVQSTFTGFLNRPHPPEDLPGRTLFERRVAERLGTLGITLPAGVLGALCDHCVGKWQDHVSLDPEALPLLERVREEVPTALVSNFDHEIHVHDVLRRTRLAPCFDEIVVSAEVGFTKPDPRIFDGVLRATGLDPRHVVYVGDADIDRDAAHGAGLRFVRIDRDGESDDGVPRITRLSELPERLRTL